MGGFVKWIGGIVGTLLGLWMMRNGVDWKTAAPGCGILGFIAGTVIDSLEIRPFCKAKSKTAFGEFATSLLVIIAAVLNIRKPIRKPSLDYVKVFLKNNFGEKEALRALRELYNILKQNPSLENACTTIRNQLDYSSRLQLSHFLYNLANINGHLDLPTQRLISNINSALRVSVSDKRTIGTTLARDESIIAAYSTLGIQRTASIIDIKKAYRTLANKYHPDKVAYLGEELRKAAGNKFQQLAHAYEIIKKERNFT